MEVTIRANCWDGMRRHSLQMGTVSVLSEGYQTETFMDRFKRGAKRLNDPTLKAFLGYGIPIMLLLHGLPPISLGGLGSGAIAAFALGDSVKGKILHAFDPLINLIQSLAYPIAGVMIAGGCLMIMIGRRDAGMQMLQNAAMGYILVQLAPLLLSILVGIGTGV